MIGKRDYIMGPNGVGYRLILIFFLMLGCSTDKKEPPIVQRAHDQNIKGILHAAPYHRAERFCSQCHGAGLVGGSQLQPSCYTCHGKTWLDRVFLDQRFPSSHVEIKGGYAHGAGFQSPTLNCASCHGSELQGAGASGPPSCLLCHEKLWE